MRVRFSHASGRFDRTSESLRRQAQRLLLVSDVVTMTEVSAVSRAAVLQQLGGIDSVVADAGGGNDGAILWHEKRHTLIYSDVVPLGTPFRRGTAVGQVHAVSVVLEDLLGDRLGVTVCHAPAHIEGPSGLRGVAARVRAYRAVMRDWKAHVRDVDTHLMPHAWIVSADWNLNFRRAWVRAYLGGIWSSLGLRAAWSPATLPVRGGTIGKTRVIDGPMVSKRAKVRSMRILPLSDASDHHAVRADLEF